MLLSISFSEILAGQATLNSSLNKVLLLLLLLLLRVSWQFLAFYTIVKMAISSISTQLRGVNRRFFYRFPQLLVFRILIKHVSAR